MPNSPNQAVSTTQVCLTDASGHPLESSKWLFLPTYRLQLTLFYTYRYHRPSLKTTTIRKVFASPDAANAAALQLAEDCRGEGEAIMLVSRNEGDVDVLNRYAVGTWDRAIMARGGGEGGKVPCKWSLMLDYERERLYSHKNGDVSAYVEVVRSWDTDVGDSSERVPLEEMQESDQWGRPPLGIGGTASYRFGRYRMHDTQSWRPFVTTTPLDRTRREELEDLSAVFADDTLTQRLPHAWHAQNISDTIAGLEQNIEILQQAEGQPRDAEARFDFDTAPIEKPAEIGWRLAKKSVVAKDITMFGKKVEKLKAEEAKLEVETEARPLERIKTVDESKHEEVNPESEFSAQSRPALARYKTDQQALVSNRSGKLADGGPSEGAGLLPPTAPTASIEDGESLPGPDDSTSASQIGDDNIPIRTNPNECKCNAHRWRREKFPTHKPLPSYEVSTPEALDPRIAAQILNPPTWALDSTHIPQCGQHFIPERPPHPEPTTLCGYIRRQLETTRPVPREAYVRLGVMAETGCENRWGPEWRLQCQNDQTEWDHERNVRRRWRRPSKPRTSEYPVSELDGYEGCLLEHEMP